MMASWKFQPSRLPGLVRRHGFDRPPWPTSICQVTAADDLARMVIASWLRHVKRIQDFVIFSDNPKKSTVIYHSCSPTRRRKNRHLVALSDPPRLSRACLTAGKRPPNPNVLRSFSSNVWHWLKRV
jgi:hypothetical protein